MQVRRKNMRTIRRWAIILAGMMLVCSSGFGSYPLRAVHAAPDDKAAADTKPAASTDANPAQAAAAKPADQSKQLIQVDQFEPYYQEVLADWQKKGYKDATSQLTIPGTQISAQSEYNEAAPGSYEGKSNVLVWKSDRTNWIEYQVDVPQDGFYEMELSYHPYNNPASDSLNRRAMVYGVEVDGKYPFREARAIAFTRLFKDQFPIKKDVNGDDIRPRPLEIKQWMNAPFKDNAGSYDLPLKWYLTKGKHTLRLSGYEPIVIDSISLKPPTKVSSYKDVQAKYPQSQSSSQDIVTIQAEQMTSKNDVSIQMQSDQDPLSVPKANGNIVFNTVGATRWATGGQTISWEFEVPESGRYKIGMRSFQGFTSNMSVFRNIYIDGKVPFQEMLNYRFPYAPKWLGTILSDDAGTPYEFYLEKGKHTLSMEATVAPFQDVILQSVKATELLREVDQELRALTGGQVDKNRTWKINEEFPELPKELTQIHDVLVQMSADMLKANGRRDNTVQSIDTARLDLEDYLKYPDEIPYHMDEIASMGEKIGGIRDTLVKASLQLDQIYVVPANAQFPEMEANFFQKINGMVHNFFYSFIKKDDLSNLSDEVLNVWVNRGRDYVNLLQELADENFTPETGIKVKVNLLPNENMLIYANAAGLNPDVALGQPQDKSIDFAMRNALVDLTQFKDFDQIKNQFAPGALLPYFYNGGYYALPETQSFKVLFYRKDILARLGLKLPDTWEDVYDMLPTLQQNGLNFNIPKGDYVTFFYQNGADFFTKDGMKTALNTPQAFKAFKQWTDLFNVYDMPKEVPSFYQHFRKGDIPIGIADYNMYIQMSVAAPELTGQWGIAPLPGVKQPDGTVARWSSGGQSSAFIYKTSKKKEEAWTFVKWLLSADTQEQYGSDLESFNGVSFRWNTANIEAFTHLPWPKDDLQVILEQWKWYKEVPNLPGSYYLAREINNGWNRTVVDMMNYRESLEQSYVDINREMLRKEIEFGFVDKDGNVKKTLDLPQVTKPWEGVDKYVTK